MQRDKAKGYIFMSGQIVIALLTMAVVKMIYGNENFEYPKPYFVSYYGDSLNVVYYFVLLRRKCSPKPDKLPPSRLSLGVLLGTLLFLQTCGYYGGLSLTSIASSVLLYNSSSIFVFLLSLVLLGQPFSWGKLGCVVLSMGGFALIAYSDTSSHTPLSATALVGDCLSVMGAAFCGLYVIMLKKLIPDDSQQDWAQLFAHMGTTVFVLYWPVFIILHLTGLELFEFPTLTVFIWITINCFLATVLGDYFWGRSVALLDALTVDLGLGLIMPLGMVLDYFMENMRYSFLYCAGAFLIASSFVAIIVLEAYTEHSERKADENFKMIPLSAPIKD